MPYSTDSDLLKEFSNEELAQLTGDPNGEVFDPERTEFARKNADALIDAYLFGRYEVPFAKPDEVIVKLSVDLTVANLYDYAYRNTSVPNTIVWRKLNAVQLLKDIQRGRVSLKNTAPGTNAPPPVTAIRANEVRIFNTDKLKEFWNE